MNDPKTDDFKCHQCGKRQTLGLCVFREPWSQFVFTCECGAKTNVCNGVTWPKLEGERVASESTSIIG